jgi:F-type H+-transporting ATPase subunit b
MADPATAAAAAAGAAADKGGAGGLPQFDVSQWPGQMVWILIIFAVLFALFNWVFVPAVGGTIDAREDKISGDIGDARRARDAARAELDSAHGEMAAARARAQRVALDAQAQAKAAATARQAQEEARLSEVMAAAEGRIAAARSEAMAHVRTIAVDTAQAMIERLSGTQADRAEVERALADAAAS